MNIVGFQFLLMGISIFVGAFIVTVSNIAENRCEDTGKDRGCAFFGISSSFGFVIAIVGLLLGAILPWRIFKVNSHVASADKQDFVSYKISEYGDNVMLVVLDSKNKSRTIYGIDLYVSDEYDEPTYVLNHYECNGFTNDDYAFYLPTDVAKEVL